MEQIELLIKTELKGVARSQDGKTIKLKVLQGRFKISGIELDFFKITGNNKIVSFSEYFGVYTIETEKPLRSHRIYLEHERYEFSELKC